MPRTTSPTKSRATPPAPAPAPPSKQYEIHPKQPPHSGPGFLGSMVQGFGLGMGSSMGHRATDAIFGQSRSGEKKKEFPQEMGCVQKPVESCEKLLHKYRDCMCGEFFHCDQIYDEYFVCIQHKK